MSLTFFRRLVLSFAVVGILTPAVVAQEERPTQKNTAEQKTRAFRGRLPNNWNKLGLTEEQREKIYAAQKATKEKSEELELKLQELRQQSMELREKITALRDQLEAELRTLLTPEQLTKLAEVEKETEKLRQQRRQERAKASISENASDSKPPETR